MLAVLSAVAFLVGLVLNIAAGHHGTAAVILDLELAGLALLSLHFALPSGWWSRTPPSA